MRLINRSQLEGELFIYQRSDVADKRRWYCSYKLKGHKRVYVSLGVCTQAEAKKEARQELMKAEDILKDYGEDATCSFGVNAVPAKVHDAGYITCVSPSSDVVKDAMPFAVSLNG